MRRFILLFPPSYITEVIIRNSENKTSVRGEKIASPDAFRKKKIITSIQQYIFTRHSYIPNRVWQW
jgi:hypothetical protein